jgi:dimethylpropiothetin dethiomethylase
MTWMSEADCGIEGGPRLRDLPDWGYLLQEFAELYRRGKAGGSARIRTHQRAVREVIGRTLAGNPPVRLREPATKPVTAHLKRAFDQGRSGPMQSVVLAIETIAAELTWLYGYEKVPQGLGQKFAYAEFAGPHGPVVMQELILGVVLFAPRCTYPAHAHEGLTESYYTLAGAVSENDDGVYAPGSLIFNPPGRMHRITVSDTEPSLLAYAWHGPPEKLANQRMVFKRAARKG